MASLASRGLRDVSGVRGERTFRGAFLLATMRKSGSHYLMSIIANYLWFAFLEGAEPLDYVSMKGLIWNQTNAGQTLERLHRATAYGSWRHRHDNQLIWFNDAKTVVHTYRNPLDTFVSRYHFFHLNRESPAQVSLTDAIEIEVPAYAWEYAPIRAVAKRMNVKRLAYEELVRDPARVVADVVEFSAIPLDSASLLRAVDSSSTASVRAAEKARGLTIGNLVGTRMTSSFIRSGTIGEWRGVLESEHVARIEEILHYYRISLDEFTLG